jgi:hypothetical protein
VPAPKAVTGTVATAPSTPDKTNIERLP